MQIYLLLFIVISIICLALITVIIIYTSMNKNFCESNAAKL